TLLVPGSAPGHRGFMTSAPSAIRSATRTTAGFGRPATLVARPGTDQLSTVGLVVLLCGAFLPLLDFFIVNVALPSMDATLHASAATLELVVAAYGVAYALMLVVGGRLGDAVGRRRLFVVGLSGFTLSSLLC